MTRPRSHRGPSTARWSFGVQALLALGACLVGCDGPDSGPVIEASAGVFYGGQVQRLQAVDWSTTAQPKIGFRLVFSEVEQRNPHRVTWELTRPGPAGRRVTDLGEQQLPPGRKQFDQVLELPPSMPLGPINVRVLVGDQVLIDRALLLRVGP